MFLKFWNKLNSRTTIIFISTILLVSFIFFLVSLGIFFTTGQKIPFLATLSSDKNIFQAESVLAKEVYPLFACPCCGKTIDANCCSMAKERKEYVDSLVKAESSKDEIILAYIKKYGLDSFKDKDKKEEFKEKLVEEAPINRPVIVINPVFYNFGDVSQKEGKVTTFFEIKNEGKQDLIIDRLDSSCGCTFASIIFKGEEGPLFAMAGHGQENPTDWKISISPGETAQLKVLYDPNVHRDFRGLAIREIYVFSNDSIDFEKKVRIELYQVD
ncbi:MAG TPA: DUF1573 domain-containing protein [Candidatus Portnoybacteria bacterium]|nr:DUF1573 domain-containing protein [Candidatus Portnoybacteria bacterium]